MESGSDLDHINKLSNLCRICGKLLSGKKDYPVSVYGDEIFTVYSVIVQNDVDNLHPKRICQLCRNVLFRVRKGKQNCESFDVSVPELFVYSKHSAECKICNIKRGENCPKSVDI